MVEQLQQKQAPAPAPAYAPAPAPAPGRTQHTDRNQMILHDRTKIGPVYLRLQPT